MISSKQLAQLGTSLGKLGARRIAVLAAVGLVVVAAVGVAAYYLGRPAMQPIYTGLSNQDISRITAALAEAGVPFDVNEQRTAVLVPFGQTARARILLAQKGLPASSRAGYELLDQLGSMGLTSFMQEITRVRALEGEIARTIQALDGVGAARVHLVLADPGSFRRERRDPSASVLLRINEGWTTGAAQAVRHIVAAAIPGMKLEHVSVASTDGRVLASGGDERSLGSMKLAEMERSMAVELEERASRTLAPTLGAKNFQISATVRLDVDRQQINETVYDPKSRVERSVKITKQSGSSEDGGNKANVGVEANVPNEEPGSGDRDKRRQREDRREELVNYELNTKTVQTVREGYRVQQLAVAVVISRKQLAATLGPNPTNADIDARLAELKRLVAAATGANVERDDRVEISAVDFDDKNANLAPVAGPGIVDYMMMNMGTAINALALLGVVFVVVWFGLRPLTRLADPAEAAGAPVDGGNLLAGGGFAGGDGAMQLDGPGGFGGGGFASSGFAGDALADQSETPGKRGQSNPVRDKLVSMVDSDDAEVTKALKDWMKEAQGA